MMASIRTLFHPLFWMLLLTSAAAQGQTPVITEGGIVNSADYLPSVATGSIVSIFGSNLAPGIDVANVRPLPTALSGVSVLVTDGAATHQAPLFFVSPGQINAQMPYGLGGRTVTVEVQTPAGRSAARSLAVQGIFPRIFTMTQDGRGEAALLRADYSVVSASNPAVPGENVVLYLTGLGEVTPAIAAGVPAGDAGAGGPLNVLPADRVVAVTVAGQPAEILWNGLAPYFAGLYQVNFKLPATVPVGVVNLTLRCAGAQSQQDVTMEVRYPESMVASGEVGAAGGVVSGGGVQVTVPAGSVPAGTAVSVYRSEESVPAAGSGVYRVQLPETFSAPLTVSFPLTTAPSAGRAFLAVRENGSDEYTSYFDGTVSGNTITGQIPALPPDEAQQQAASEKSASRAAGEIGRGFTLWAIAGWYAATSPSGKFEMLYPAPDLIEGAADELLRALDQAYTTLESYGLSWSKRTSWPLRCVLEEFTGDTAERVGEERPDKRGDNYTQIGFNITYLGNRQAVQLARTTVGHELFHVMQRLYDPRNRYSKAVSSGIWLWGDEALSTWFERRIAGGPYVSSSVRRDPGNPNSGADNYVFVRRGLEFPPGDAGPVQNHGYGASMFLEHLSTVHGNSVVAGLLQRRATQGIGLFGAFAYSPVAAIHAVTGDVGMAWRRFSEKYMAGTVYDSSPVFPEPGDIISGATIVRFENNKQSHKFSWNMQDLSTQTAVLNFRPDTLNWPANAKLKLSLIQSGDGAEAIVYKLRAGAGWERVGIFDASDPLEIAGIRSLMDSGYDLVIMVANGRAVAPYTGTQLVELNVNMEQDTVSNYSKSHQPLFYNNRWIANVNIEVSTSGSLGTYQEQVAAGRLVILTVPIQPADTTPAPTDTYTVRVTLSGVALVGGEIPKDYNLIVRGQFDGDPIVTGSTFEKTIQVQRGSTSGKTVSFSVILYYLTPAGAEQWQAGDSLFSLRIVPPSWMN